MSFHSISEEERKRFLRQSYEAHLPGYTGHCPTLKFRVGKRFGACTQEIMRELLEKKILKTGPYRPNSGKENATIVCQNGRKPMWKNEPWLFKAPPYVLGYTGYIPGFNSRYGLPFMRAVEEGAKEWREQQEKLKASRDAARPDAGRNDTCLLVYPRMTVRASHDRDETERTMFYYEISPERPPIVGYTGHIPGARGELSLSKRYGQAAKEGLELMRKEREQRFGKTKDTNAISTTALPERNTSNELLL